jgi:hypothetical protein
MAIEVDTTPATTVAKSLLTRSPTWVAERDDAALT